MKPDDALDLGTLDVTDDELQAVLAGMQRESSPIISIEFHKGTNIPQKIPVNVLLNPSNGTDNLFGPPEVGTMSPSTQDRHEES